MEKNIRIAGKILLIILCVICFIYLIQKDKTIFQLKQPEGEVISWEEVRILMQAVGIDLESVDYENDEREGAFLYEEYRGLLAFLMSAENIKFEYDTYEGKYRDDFLFLKEDWYCFFDSFLMQSGLNESIYRKEFMILTEKGKEDIQEEKKGDGITGKKMITAAGEELKYCSSAFKDCIFSKVTAYVMKKEMNGQEVLLTVFEKGNDCFELPNVWVMEANEAEVRFFYCGYEMSAKIGKEKGTVELKREMVSDLTFQSGKLTDGRQKTERVNARVLRVDDKELELEGKDRYEIAEGMKIYRLYEELQEGTYEDIKIGYDFTDFVMEDGKICAALVLRKENMENIRVAIRNEGFASLYHEELSFVADCDMELIYGTYGDRKKEVIPAGQNILIERGSDYVKGDRVEIVPVLKSGKIELLSFERNQGTPVYRGRMEIEEKEEGLILINELLLEEYLYSVVPSEMPASYPKEALKAQAICARTYAYQYLNAPGLSAYGAHVDDSVAYQVYNNIAENSESTGAVKETTGEMLFYDGEVVSTYYYSTSCGFGADAGVWKEENKEAMPYLVSEHIAPKDGEEQMGEGEINEGQEDWFMQIRPEDMRQEEVLGEYLHSVNVADFEAEEAWYRWEYEVADLDVKELSEKLQERYEIAPDKVLTMTESENFESNKPQEFEEIYEMTVLERREGGVAEELLLETESGTYKIISEYNIRYLLSQNGEVKRQDEAYVPVGQLLPSAYLVIDADKEGDCISGYKIVGGGYGHGVGMSQNGAKNMAKENMDYSAILEYFYHDCELRKMY